MFWWSWCWWGGGECWLCYWEGGELIFCWKPQISFIHSPLFCHHCEDDFWWGWWFQKSSPGQPSRSSDNNVNDDDEDWDNCDSFSRSKLHLQDRNEGQENFDTLNLNNTKYSNVYSAITVSHDDKDEHHHHCVHHHDHHHQNCHLSEDVASPGMHLSHHGQNVTKSWILDLNLKPSIVNQNLDSRYIKERFGKYFLMSYSGLSELCKTWQGIYLLTLS